MAAGWKLPTASVDLGGGNPWSATDMAAHRHWDGSTGSDTGNTLTWNQWTNYIESTITPGVYCDKIRIWAYSVSPNDIDNGQVDVFYGGSWYNVLNGAYAHLAWQEVALGGTFLVTKMRIRFFNDAPDAQPHDAHLYEHEFYDTGFVASSALAFAPNF